MATLPPLPGLGNLARENVTATPGRPQAWSWVEYFIRNTRKTFEELGAAMEDSLRSPS